MAQPGQLQGAPVPASRPESVERDDGQTDDFCRFFRKEYRSVIGSVMRAGARFEDAEDAVIEAMTLAEAQFRELASPGAWVRVVAIRLYSKREVRDREVQRREQDAPHPAAPPQPGDGDLSALVRDVLRDLPSIQRLIMALNMDGYKPSEIASMINSSPDTVRSNLRHARRAMAAGLAQGGWNV